MVSIYFGKLLTTAGAGAGADATQKLSKTKSVWEIVKTDGDCRLGEAARGAFEPPCVLMNTCTSAYHEGEA